MHLDLTRDEATFLEDQLTRRLRALNAELARSDAADRELARDAARLETILTRLRRWVDEESSYA